MSNPIRGNQCAMVTPFNAEGAIDEASLEKLVEHLITAGVHGILAVGTTGEAFSLEVAERKYIAEKVVKLVARRVQVGVMIGYVGTRPTIELGRHAESIGADYVLVPPPPSAFPLSGRGLASYYTEVARALQSPVMVYDGGGGAEVPLSVWPSIVEQAENIRYAKVSVQDPPRLRTLLDLLHGHVQPLAGKEETVLAMLGNGAVGMVSGVSNVLPADVSAMYVSYSAGKLEDARDVFYRKINPIVTMTFAARNEYIQCLKTCLCWMGVISVSATRHPLPPLDAVRVRELRGAIEFAGVPLRS